MPFYSGLLGVKRFGAVVIIFFVILMARIFEFFNTAFWVIVWVIA
ncbi:putative membrane protein [Helicobacter pylori Hp H-36]|nr:putative membrane protein [Helicobacter pylori Hp H-36]EJB95685.1 putative membrane protein [Helicobacter pylori Hp H-23]